MHLSIFGHPHHYAASIVAKLATCLATIIWAVVVLSRQNALEPDRFSFYAVMTNIMPEDNWALFSLFFAAGGVYTLIAKTKPRWWGGIGYALQTMFWSYLAGTYVFFSPLPLRPATAASIIVIAILSVYAFVANPRRKLSADPADRQR